METETEKSVTDRVAAITAAVKSLEGRTRDGVRATVVEQDVNELKRQFAVPDELGILDKGYLAAIRTKAEQRFDAETRDLVAAIGPAFAPLRADLAARLAAARRVPLESERCAPDSERYVMSRLLDEIATDRAEKWLAAHADDLAAVAARYEAADDRRDSALVRVIEDKYGLTSEAPGESSEWANPVAKLVRQRQDSRIAPADRDAGATIDAAEQRFIQARMSANPTSSNVNAAIGELIARGKK